MICYKVRLSYLLFLNIATFNFSILDICICSSWILLIPSPYSRSYCYGLVCSHPSRWIVVNLHVIYYCYYYYYVPFIPLQKASKHKDTQSQNEDINVLSSNFFHYEYPPFSCTSHVT